MPAVGKLDKLVYRIKFFLKCDITNISQRHWGILQICLFDGWFSELLNRGDGSVGNCTIANYDYGSFSKYTYTHPPTLSLSLSHTHTHLFMESDSLPKLVIECLVANSSFTIHTHHY